MQLSAPLAGADSAERSGSMFWLGVTAAQFGLGATSLAITAQTRIKSTTRAVTN